MGVFLDDAQILGAFGFLIDSVGRFHLAEWFACSYSPPQRILPDMLKEEVGHLGFKHESEAEIVLRAVIYRCKFFHSTPLWGKSNIS